MAEAWTVGRPHVHAAKMPTEDRGMIAPTWTAKITAYLSDRIIPTTVSQISREALGISYEHRLAYDLTAISRVLRRMGWKRVQGNVTRWFPPGYAGAA
jgi:hypothetical protein